ncbi:MAG: hypothetical protein A2287_06275 [Candidatus Melainabacteria bacterium RIFOXYA12_FULL_32_12]|nr:MAG: hypothetical protein A2255_01875 [Candidatus Melainabacteria bacterium RIFOXYA2_FULL_32_9]OGI31027.1 MAG: hypothetical protein A2287_06275 [Candidatus Melainabacteria bacterium RIFOXYA12_FULL_32_12]
MILDFDKYSLKIDSERLLIRSAAFHYFRVPGINVWKDRLSKIKACGYNAVDLYFNWGYHSKQPGIYDFTDIKDLRALLDITVELGLYVIARPGPYINAEVSAGGLPPWLFNVPDVIIRNRKDGDFVHSNSYMQAVKEWYSRIIPLINEYHNVIALQIENEYSTNEAEPNYIQDLYDMARAMGVKAPLFHNDAFCACLYSDIVNIYALDTYPTINLNYDWRTNPYGFGTIDHMEDCIRSCSEDSPLFIAELQAGWFDKWDGFGYEYIRKLFGREHINIVTKTALSQGVTMFNHYMGCGGTSWGQLACDEVYTSYDFAAPVSEYGIPQENYYKAKELNYFLQAFNLSSTDVAVSEDAFLEETDERVFIKIRQDNLNNCKWLFIRNLYEERKEFKIKNQFNLSLKPFDMKILPMDLDLYGCKLDFSGLSIFSRIQKDNYEVIFLLLDENQEMLISGFDNKKIPQEIQIEEANHLKIKFNNLPEKDLFSCKFIKGEKVTEFVFLKEETADRTWIIQNEAVIGPDFIMDNPYKAAFSENREVKVLNLNKNSDWQAKNIDMLTNQELNYTRGLEWTYFKCAPEIEIDYDYSDWNLVKSPEKLDCISNRVYDEFIWYKGGFHNIIEQIELNVKHCYAIYLNGTQIFQHDFLYYDCGKELSELITINVDTKILHKDKDNEITVLVRNLGFNKGFENAPNLPRGILNFKTMPYKEIGWRIRGGLTPEIEEWDFINIDNLEDASDNSYLIWASASFEVNLPENIYAPLYLDLNSTSFDKANIYLNGNLIGHYLKTKEPQTKFYLPDGFIKQKNRISLLVWNKDNYQRFEDYKFEHNNVIITIRHIGQYNLVDLKKLV